MLPGEPDPIAGMHPLAHANVDPREVRDEGPHAAAVRDHHGVAPAAVTPPRPDHLPAPGRTDRRAERRDQVHAGVEPGPAEAVGARSPPLRPARRGAAARRRAAPAALGR